MSEGTSACGNQCETDVGVASRGGQLNARTRGTAGDGETVDARGNAIECENGCSASRKSMCS